MNTKTYIASGILELYALNLLPESKAAEVSHQLTIYKDLAEEFGNICVALESYANHNPIAPNKEVEGEILAKLRNLRRERFMDPFDLPLINKHTEPLSWDKFVAGIERQPIGEDGRTVKVLTSTQKVLQLLVTSSTDFELETHDDEYESFLILSGELLCTMGNQTIMMAKGDFMDIPLHQPHEVKLVSPVVTAILQRVKAI